MSDEALLGTQVIGAGNCANPYQVFRVALNLKRLIDKVVPTVFDTKDITAAHSAVLNTNVLKLAYRAAGGKGDGAEGTLSCKHRAGLVFALLKVTGWYWDQAEHELANNELYSLRAVAAQQLAAMIIEDVAASANESYLFLGLLCHRYQISTNGEISKPVSAVELAVDMHSTIVIGSSGFQRCIKWLWRGWIVQSATDPHLYVLYDGTASAKLQMHFDPARVKTPAYQNILEVFFSVCFLVLYSIIVNSKLVEVTSIDVFEGLLYMFTLGLVIDEITKVYHVGWCYIGFWNVLNDVMYGIIIVSVTFRFLSLSALGAVRENYDEISFRVLSCAAPLMWSRLLLFLDAQQFVGALMVVTKTMMRELILFFVLLAVVILGFSQGFLGLDALDGKTEATRKILVSLVNATIGMSDFSDFKNFVPPYASIMYYIYSFMLLVILMNILIALYSSAYASIVENATDESFALKAQKTLRYVRAPDTDLYVPPFNVLEVCIYPARYFMSWETYRRLNYYIMMVIYFPILIYIAYDERSNARRVQYNRFKGVPDDANEVDTEWDMTDGFEDGRVASGWEGIRNRSSEINEGLRLQRAGERADPEFPIDLVQFDKDIRAVVQPVAEANDKGVRWDLFALYQKIDQLTELVETVLQENTEIRQQVGQIRDAKLQESYFKSEPRGVKPEDK
ncbi:vacuolar cation channel [Metschnikowia bicuspidata]|uniref:Vacuolar cation channel n=1 Tax=Metschnikowia bicuspidata TaxID=27322 RepID=A0A4P9ZJ66_9ASCO|nr:vacuolar cation channel [Metschnikowia bicuspidata]